ncbi:MAG: protein kinase [Myxococcales bacterium]|nr:protein kinase [Myxococcales bacterium]
MPLNADAPSEDPAGPALTSLGATRGEPTLSTADFELDERPLAPGASIDGRYRIEERLGVGGMGTVYRAVHVGLDRPVAIKILTRVDGGSTAARRFRAEGRLTAALHHPGIVEVLDTGELADGRLYLVMELLEGRTLDDAIAARGGELPWREACLWIAEIADAVAAAHRRGLIHRDLKPSNIMVVDEDGRARLKVLDFGIAAERDLSGDARLTRPGQLLGTPRYMAPEQADGLASTPQMDIYALGAILFEAICGSAPFEDKDPFEVVAHKRRVESPSLVGRCPDVPPALCELVGACLARTPTRRPASAAELADRLRALVVQLPDAPPRRRGRLALVGGAGAATAALAIALVVGLTRDPGPADAQPTATQARAANEPAPALANEPATATAGEPRLAHLPATPTTDEPLPASAAKAAELHPDVAAREPATPEPATATSTAESSTRGGQASRSDRPRASALPERCTREREAALDARRAHNWPALLRHSAESRCWSDPEERRALRVRALLESGDYAGCIREGEGSGDREVRSLVALCVSRGGA